MLLFPGLDVGQYCLADLVGGQVTCIQVIITVIASVDEAQMLFGNSFRTAIYVRAAKSGCRIRYIEIDQDVRPRETLPHIVHK